MNSTIATTTPIVTVIIAIVIIIIIIIIIVIVIVMILILHHPQCRLGTTLATAKLTGHLAHTMVLRDEMGSDSGGGDDVGNA